MEPNAGVVRFVRAATGVSKMFTNVILTWHELEYMMIALARAPLDINPLTNFELSKRLTRLHKIMELDCPYVQPVDNLITIFGVSARAEQLTPP